MKIKPAVNLVVGVVLLCIGAAPALAQPVLTLEGSCPGEMRAEVTGATPNRGISLLLAFHRGSWRIRPPHPCQGVVLGLGWRGLRYVDSTVADENGFAFFEGTAGPAACGLFLQTLSNAVCETSNVIQIP